MPKSMVWPFVERFGGFVFADDYDRWKTCFKWKVSARKAVRFLEAIQPHVMSARKRLAISLAVEFQKHQHHFGNGEPAPVIYRKRQGELWRAMRRLNRRGKATE